MYIHGYEGGISLFKWSHTVQFLGFFLVLISYYLCNLRLGNERFGRGLLCLMLFKKVGEGAYEISPVGKLIFKHKYCGMEMYKKLWNSNIYLPHLEKLKAHQQSIINNAEIDLQFSFVQSFKGRIYTYGLEPFLGTPRSVGTFPKPNFVGSVMDIYSVDLPFGLKIVISFYAGGDLDKYAIKKAAGIVITISC